MRTDWSVLLTALRAAAWLPIRRSPGELGLARLVLWSALLIAVWVAFQYVHSRGSDGSFNPYGLNAMVAWLALLLTVTGLFVPAPVRMTFLVVSVALAVILELAFEALTAPLIPTLMAFVGDDWWRWMFVWMSSLALYGVWWTGAVTRILGWLEPARAPVLRRACAMWCALIAAFAVTPHYPSFIGRDFQRPTANVWEFARAMLGQEPQQSERRESSVDLARTELAQPFLVEAMTSQLMPERPGRTDVYFVGLAGWADQDVFYKELTGALDVIDRNLPVEGRVALLINNPGSVSDVPLANRQNFAAIVRAVGQRMNKDEDILFLFMTSHGSRDGVALSLPGSVQAMLSPQDVATVLDREGIKNRVVVVSACHSGVFIKPLANEHTVVLTAAHEDNTSFGCSNEREWTYFGDALFKHSLKPGRDLRASFDEARALIGAWEARDGVTPSNPQAHFGASLMDRLAPLYAKSAAVEEPPQRAAALRDDAPRLAPALERGPQPAVEPEAVDRR
jgi:hypothetical protein